MPSSGCFCGSLKKSRIHPFIAEDACVGQWAAVLVEVLNRCSIKYHTHLGILKINASVCYVYKSTDTQCVGCGA